MWLLALMLVVAVGITPFVEIDRVVSSSSGQIVSVRSALTFQTLDPSIIKSVDVREGESVAAGQLLATLDPTFAKADVGQQRQQVASLDAQIARLVAEKDHKPLTFAQPVNPEEAPFEALQAALFAQRSSEYAAQMRSFDEKIRTSQATIAKLQNDVARYAARADISQAIEGMRDTLYKSGASSRLSLLEANDARLEMQRTMESDRNGVIEAQHQLAAAQADRDAYVQKWLGDVSQDLVKVRDDREAATASLLKASRHQDLVRLVAPEPSVVLTLSKLSVGSVLKEGDSLMSLVPLSSPLEAEVHIASRDIGFVRTGDPVSLKVDAFNYYEHGSAEGRLIWISEGSFSTDEGSKPVEPYYKARVGIAKLGFHDVPKTQRLIPGMTLRADISVGKRSLFRYILGGFVQGTGEAMREP
ncbi:HlyD family type I secretion periplasmic adaptor subunit [Lichenibacterium dinghuense]|uniref:HlyD family type I secretion periplasmic adaptor subunit n=1 Tax=Lichenibacterium dinghuense TaxID=2895977 RepID=UPI001F015826|nr:HlyD family type I secretion periplasmic adaptor subunit [Lichenibacterium sp. 6Y81]